MGSADCVDIAFYSDVARQALNIGKFRISRRMGMCPVQYGMAQLGISFECVGMLPEGFLWLCADVLRKEP